MIQHSKLQSDDMSCRNLTLQLHGHVNMHWWELMEDCDDDFHEKILSQVPYADCKKNIVLYTFNERLYSQTLSSIIGRGYVSLSN